MSCLCDGEVNVSILIVGDCYVGKRCLIEKYITGSFREIGTSTIGVDYRSKKMNISDKRIHLRTWDTSGDVRHQTITSSYYRKMDGILVMFDVTDRFSFDSISKFGGWMEQIRQHAETDTNIILVGNKCDVMDSKRKVSTSEGQSLANEFIIPYFETSAITHNNIEQIFNSITTDIITRQKTSKKFIKPMDGIVKLEQNVSKNVKKFSNCC